MLIWDGMVTHPKQHYIGSHWRHLNMEEATQTTYNFILLHNQHYNYYILYEIFEPILQSFTGTATHT